MAARPSKKARQAKPGGPKMSPKTRNALLIGSGSVLVLILGYWAYFNFTTMTPPDLANVKPEDAKQLAIFVGSERGLPRMPLERQKEFLIATFEKFPDGPAREKLVEAMNQMSPGEREVLQNAVFQIARKEVVTQAKEYNGLPSSQRMAFVDSTIRNFEKFRGAVTGARPSGGAVRAGGGGQTGNAAPGPAQDITKPLKSDLPTSSDEMLKTVVSRTSASERAQAQPFVDAMADRYKQMKGNEELKKQLLGG